MSDGQSLSDHRNTRFNFESEQPITTSVYRNPMKTDWDLYSKNLAEELGNNTAKAKSSAELERVRLAIAAAYEAICPVKAIK